MVISDRARALHEAEDQRRLDVAARYRVTPKDMTQPMAVRIKEHHGRPLYGDIHIPPTKYPGGKKLQHGEIVILDMAEDWVQELFASGKIEVTTELATRPIVYDTPLQAKHARSTYQRHKDPTGYDQSMAEINVIVGRIRSEFAAKRTADNSPAGQASMQREALEAAEARPRRGRPPKSASAEA